MLYRIAGMGLLLSGLAFLAPLAAAQDQAQGAGTVEVEQTDEGLQGRLHYRLTDGHEDWPADKRERIIRAMNEAVLIYNLFSSFDKEIRVTYNPNVPTADGNFNGHIRFGGSISTRTALHEISHVLGVGTTREWRRGIEGGVWQGERGQAVVRAFNGPEAVLRGDRQHLWPYGLNFDREGTDMMTFIRHVMVVEAVCRDMGLNVFAAPAE